MTKEIESTPLAEVTPPKKPSVRRRGGQRVSLTPTEARNAKIVAAMLGMTVSSMFRKMIFESSLFRYMKKQSIDSNALLVAAAPTEYPLADTEWETDETPEVSGTDETAA